MRDIKNYEGLYAVTSCGRVWSYRRKKFIDIRLDKDGYPRVTLCKNGEYKTFFIHRLVAQAYIPNPDNLPEVNHKDEIKNHSYLNNLEWCTHYYNVNYGTRNERAGATRKGKKSRCKAVYSPELDETLPSTKAVEEKYGIDQGTVSKCCHGKRNYAGRHPVTGELLTWRFVE